ncbi:hypothetical protein GCM10009865_55060 [Aeromicrobium ponti]|uniref:Uncharacterized protein DUF3139 n=1 Tax=Cytobacillus oceanisediminis TaxID=665099 RepID=A0A562J1A3_9BACI|nr:DUF3139 domain-containing protein [Cytobacillus oceanisediminis]TWH76966.1 uncharacterized protein DUF3139 [Cytobacillus oceanisediminis]
MKRFLIIIFSFCLIILAWVGFKLNFIHYEKQADERIAQVIEFQGASIENRDILVDLYDYKNGCWYQRTIYKDDPEITYDYEYTRSENKVRVFAMYKNMSLDLANKQAKYPLYDIYFNGDKIIEVIER